MDLGSNSQPKVISLDDIDDSLNPVKWPDRYKWTIIGLISAMNLVM